LSFGKSKVALKVPVLSFDNAPSAGFQLLKSPITAAVFASFASIEKVTLTTGFVFITCFLIAVTNSFIDYCGKVKQLFNTIYIRNHF
jgi:hypothetical protein